MAGTVSVWIEGDADTVVEKRISKVSRVYIRQVGGKDSSRLPEQENGGLIDGWMFSTIGLSKGLLPSSIPRKQETSSLLSFEFPFGPKQVNYSSHALQYTEIRRPGMKPLLRAMNPKNRTISMNAVIADRTSHGLGSCEDQLQTLKDMSVADLDVEFVHGVVTFPARLRITGFTINSTDRNLQGEVTKAKVSLNLKESIPLNVDMIWLKAVTEEPEPVANLNEDDEKEPKGGTSGQEAGDPLIALSGLTGYHAKFNTTTADLLGLL